jgi:hypothetical protein
MMTATRSLKVLLTLSVILISEAILSIASASPACDAEFMTTLRNRAWREAQREITMNQANIYKPDSVFSMSCFGSALGAVPATFTQGTNTDAARRAVESYMGANFNHGFVGGAGSQTGNEACGQMARTWETSQCRNLTLAQFIALGADPRPAVCERPDWAPSGERLAHVGVIGPDSAGFDSVSLFLRNTDPLSLLTAGTACQAGIPTGVNIGAGSTSSYAEKVCPNPGCVPVLRTSGSTSTLRCCDQNAQTTRCEP